MLEDELEEGVLESRTVILYGADDRPLEEIQLDAADVETGASNTPETVKTYWRSAWTARGGGGIWTRTVAWSV